MNAPISLESLWPAWPAERILFEDDDLIVVDKPVRVSTHASDDEQVDDVFHRLTEHLKSKALAEGRPKSSESAYLGIHQRLDRDTSGVLLMSKRRSANASLAKQFETRTVEKQYTAVVVDSPKLKTSGQLVHRLVPEHGGKMRVVVAGQRHAAKRKPTTAITEYQVIARSSGLALVTLSPQTGRTHQLRVQLAQVGAPILGDQIYGGPPAARLMLHAHGLSLQHPATDVALHFKAPMPEAFDLGRAAKGSAPAAIDLPGDVVTLASRMRAAAAQRYGLWKDPGTTAFRLVNDAGDGLEGITIELYERHLVLSLTSERTQAMQDTVIEAASRLGPDGIYLKVRPKQASRVDEIPTDKRAPSDPVWGMAAPTEFLVRENGLPYAARLSDGLSTGLFLDQRNNRAVLQSLSNGKRFLNLFAYCGAFSVAALAGGAASSITLDVSSAVLERAKENMARITPLGDQHQVVEADALTWMAAAEKTTDRFDVIALDPPSFATTKHSRFSAERDYRALAASALQLLRPGGKLLACTNHRRILRAKFRRYLHEAAAEAGREVSQMKDLSTPRDFPHPPLGESHLKTALVTVR